MFLGREINKTQDYSEETAKRIDEEVSALLDESYQRAVSIITENKDKLNKIATLLLEQETLDGRDVIEIVEHGRVLSEEERQEVDLKEEEKRKKETGDKSDNNSDSVPNDEEDAKTEESQMDVSGSDSIDQ